MKTNSINLGRKIKSILLFCISLTLFSSCQDYMQGKTFVVSDERMIDEYIEQKDSSMSEFLKVADKAGFRGMLHAYGTNTCFIPTNEAIDVYCKRAGISSLESLPAAELENLIKYHIVRDTIKTADFVDGRLSKATMLGKFLTTKTIQSGASDPILRVNRQANVLKSDIHVANGIIHKIDYLLTPNPKTVGEMIDQLPDTYSLFKSIMKETKLTDTLTINNGKDQWYTVLLQSNAAFATANVTDRATLLAKMRLAQPDVKSDELLLLMYAKYHCINRLAYAADLSLSSSELTLAPNQVVTFKTKQASLILNEYESLTKFEVGVNVDKDSEWTDMSCSNGAMIDLSGYIQPVKRGAEAVYWEISDQPEIKKLKEYRKPGSTVTFKPGELSELNFGGKNSPTINYTVASAFAEKTQYVHLDFLGVRFYPNIVQWMELKTPVLTEGVYNVWISWRTDLNGGYFKTTFKEEGKEDQVLSNLINIAEYFANKNTPEVNYSLGMKRYFAKMNTNTFNCRLMGVIKVDYTGRHTLRLDVLGGKNAVYGFDMIQFIPVEQDQLWPRFDVDGKAIYPTTPCGEIAPTSQTFCN
jgi:uncharacterized surface protein with fasciclin (FAS1) repeats